jgi:uncharacterized delta-60 repeat protein
MMRRQGCGHISAACACLILALALPVGASAAKPKAGQLDRGFGHGGKIIGPLVATAPSLNLATRTENMATALGPEGTIAVAVNNTLFEYGPDGKPRRDFGKNGRLTISLPGQVFELAGVAIDAKGRILVAGTSTPAPRQWMLPPGQFETKVIATDAAVIRYSPDGKLDRSFANNGAFVSDLGLPHPTDSVMDPIKVRPVDYTFPAASVHLTGIALDQKERPVLSGDWVRRGSECYVSTPVWERSAFAARLGHSGRLDAGFGSGGVSNVLANPAGNLEDGSPRTDEIALEPNPANGRMTFTVLAGACLRGTSEVGSLIRLDEAGAADQGFGLAGRQNLELQIESHQPPSVAIDPRGRTLVAELKEAQFGAGAGGGVLVRRFAPDGRSQQVLSSPARFSGSFGFPAIGVDSQSRPLLLTPVSPANSTRLWNPLRLKRLKANGKPDRRFGDAGTTTVGFGKASQVTASNVILDSRGGILVAGFRRVKHHPLFSSFALARFRGQ